MAGVIVLAFGFLGYRLLAERGRRKTLEATYQAAPGGTIVELGGGPAGPPMIVRVGYGVPLPAVHVHVPGPAPGLRHGERT
jgi:hypothetical protein